ncbi:MAG: ParB/RepB/Spo0J family partition protein [Betaproteobacteria bacterium]|nr:ParB/RepB/Spo0J family partition protein [Betaproteobacteria bacterium]
MAKMKGLGRGLDALLSNSEEAKAGDQLVTLSLDALKPGKFQPRTRMHQGALQELADSIKAQGIMQPVLVRRADRDGKHEIIAGERRWRAALLAGLSEMPALVRDVADQAAAALSLIENIQREDLNPLEEAMGFKRLIDDFGLTHEQIAQAVGRSRSAVTNLLRLTQLAAQVQDLLFDGALDMGHARALLSLTTDQQILLANRIAQRGMSVRDAERMVQNTEQGRKGAGKTPKPAADADLHRLETELADALGATVKIQAGKKGAGKVVINYGSLDQLDGILAKLR